MNENLEKLVQLARNKKAAAFKSTFADEVNSRLTSKIADMKQVLAKTMFAKKEGDMSREISEEPKEHTHDDGTVHTHEGGDEPHTHEEKEIEEGKLPPALQKAIDAKKKGKKDDDEDEEETDENLHNFKGKKAKPFKKDKKKVDEAQSGDKEAYQKYFNAMLKKFGVKSAAELKDDEKKKFYDAIDAGWEGDNESD